MNEQTLGQRIAAERKKLGLSQEALGEKMNVSRQAISKWESDSAVPEIDKLIAMSRLFGISLGWLLGVEEQPSQTAPLSDEQLELIRRMIPQPSQPRRAPWIIAIALSAAALIAALLPGRQTAAADYNQQIANLQSQCQHLQESLLTLTHRLEVLTQEDAEVLLLDHTIRFHGLQPDGTGRILFSAVPKEWLPGQTAALRILRNGTVGTEVPCTMDSALYTATADLPLEDGYEYRFVLTSSDGSQTFQLLEDSECSDLKSGTTIQLEYSSIPTATYRRGTLEFYGLSIGFSMPRLTEKSTTAAWKDLAYALTVNGSLVERQSLFDTGVMDEAVRYNSYGTVEFLGMIFETELRSGDQVALTFEASLSTGEANAFPVGTWTYTNGKLSYTN